MPKTSYLMSAQDNAPAMSRAYTTAESTDIFGTVKATNQRVDRLPLSLLVSGNYQRPTSSRQVNDIVENFDEAKLGMPIVGEVDGTLYLLDGNHRVAAMRKLNYTHAQFIVLESMTYELCAEFFMTQDSGSRRLSRYNLYRAGLQAKNALYITIDRIVQKNGYTVGCSSKRADVITAIHALEIIATQYGFEVLDDTLSLIRDTWEGIKNATNREFLVGVAEFVKRYGKCDFADRMRLRKIGLIWQDYAAGVASYSRSSSDPSMRRAFCRVLVEHYNKGLASMSRKRLKWED